MAETAMKPILLVLLALGLTACSSLSTHHDGDLRRLQHIYVEHLLTDNHRIDTIMVAELKALGYDAACGPMTMMPEQTDAIITYRERSAWDFKSYLIELNLEVKGRFSEKTIATGRYYQPSVHTKGPEEVVRAVIQPLFPRR